jgi:NADPH:quinone reductase-like Zn-dependent oxidoreductase
MNSSNNNSMKAAFITQYGTKDTLILGELDKPQINDNQVLIKVAAAGVNPVDFHIRNGMLDGTDTHTLPLVLGWDLSGEIVQLGKDVIDFKQGDLIFAFSHIGEQGAYAQYIAVDASLVAFKPKNQNHYQSAATPLAAVTAWQALTKEGLLSLESAAGKKVLIHNASGGVGSFAVQMAKYLGAHVIASASGAKASYVKSLGADELIDYQTQDFTQIVKDVDLVLAAVGGQDTLQKSLTVLKEGGRLISTLDELDANTVIPNKIHFSRMWVQPNGSDLRKIGELMEADKLKVHLDAIYPLEDVQAAHQRSEEGKTIGKIVLNIAAHEFTS